MADPNTPTDFNDLAAAQGNDAVAQQIGAAIEASLLPPEPSTDGRSTLEQCLARYAMTDDGRVFDSKQDVLLSLSRAKAVMGNKVYSQWQDHAERKNVASWAVIGRVREARQKSDETNRKGLDGALERYVYIYPTNEAWDRVIHAKVPLSGVKNLLGDDYKKWENSDRRVVRHQSQIVFDPADHVDTDCINTFRGLPLTPVDNPDACRAIRALIYHLCNQDEEVFKFLVSWLALPLQRPGTKLASAVLMHGETQGAGKSLHFDEIMRRIYGDYGATVGQDQLESQYNDWRSEKLFVLFEEVLSRAEKYNRSGTIKHVITGKTQRVEKKFMSGWEEANYANVVFLSNEVQPLPVDPGDRRLLVIWPKSKLPPDIKRDVMREINTGGVAAFLHWLLSWDCGEFESHTEPPMTEAKERLIDFGRASWDTFHMLWSTEQLDLPYTTCLSTDLYRAYRAWCHRSGEHAISHAKFGLLIAAREHRRRDVEYHLSMDTKKGTVFLIGKCEPGTSQQVWVGRCIKRFQERMPNEGDAL